MKLTFAGAADTVTGSRHLIDTTRAEEERFLATIEGGLVRFDQLAPLGSTQGSTYVRGTISGDDTIFLATDGAADQSRLRERLRTLFGI